MSVVDSVAGSSTNVVWSRRVAPAEDPLSCGVYLYLMPALHSWMVRVLEPNIFASLRKGVRLFLALFRWFKFTLKPPYSIAHDNLRLAIWDTSFWTFWLKFGHKGP